MQTNTVYDTLNTRGITLDDVMKQKVKSVVATIMMLANTKVSPMEPLVSTDGGKTFKPAYKEEYDSAKTDYGIGTEVISDGHIFTALVDNPEANTISDEVKWRDDGEYTVNGFLMVTFERETSDNAESFKAAVMTDGVVVYSKMVNVNESTRVAAFPNIIME